MSKITMFNKNKNNSQAEIAVISLINKFFWKSKTGPITTILLPLSFMLIYKLIEGTDGSAEMFIDALPAFICLSILPITLMTLPQMLVEIKHSIILRRISTSSITPIKYNLIIASWFFIMCVLSTLMVFIIFLMFLNTEVGTKLSYINFGDLIFALLMLYISAISTGIVIASLAKKSSSAQLIGLSIMFLTLILAGQFVPISVIGNVEAVKYISLFFPINYSTGLLNNALIKPIEGVDGSIFSITDFIISGPGGKPGEPAEQITIIASWQKVLNLIMPPVIFIGFNFIGYKNFSWSSR